MADSKGKKQKHKCPPIPDGWTDKFTGPEVAPGDTVGQAQRKWKAYVRRIQRLGPMPRTTR